MNVHIVCDTDTIGVCRGMRSTLGRRGYKVINIALDLLKTVSFNGGLSFERWVEIKGHYGVGLVVLKVNDKDLEWNVNRD